MSLLILALNALLSLSVKPISISTDTATPVDASVTPAPDDGDLTANPARFEWSVHLLLSLSKSKSPRDWALLAQILSHDAAGAMRVGGPLLRKAAAAAPTDGVVQRLWASASLEASGCDVQHSCPERSMAWSKLEPDNGAAWIPVVVNASVAKDGSAVDTAIERFAQASRYDDSIGDLLVAWKDVFQRNPLSPDMLPQPVTPHALAETTPTGMAVTIITDMKIPSYQSLMDACNLTKQPDANAQRFENCGKVGHLMLGQSSRFIGRMIGAGVLRVSGTANANDIAIAKANRWQMMQFGKNISKMKTDINMLNGFTTDYEVTGSEIEVAQRVLRRADVPFTPPTDWQPTSSNGEPIGALGEQLPPAKRH